MCKEHLEWVVLEGIDLTIQRIVLLKSYLQVFSNTQSKSELAITISGFYENEKLESVKKFFNFKNVQSVFQKGYSEDLGYTIKKR